MLLRFLFVCVTGRFDIHCRKDKEKCLWMMPISHPLGVDYYMFLSVLGYNGHNDVFPRYNPEPSE